MRIARFVHSGGMSFGVGRGRGGRELGRPRRSPRSKVTRSGRSRSPASAGRSPTCGCCRRSCPARWCVSDVTTSSTPPSTTLRCRRSRCCSSSRPPRSSATTTRSSCRRSRTQVEHEAELAVVIGVSGARRVDRAGAEAAIFGYTVRERRHRPRSAAQRRPVDAGQGLRLVLPARPVDHHRPQRRATSRCGARSTTRYASSAAPRTWSSTSRRWCPTSRT